MIIQEGWLKVVIIPLWEGLGHSFEKKNDSLHLRMFCAKYGWRWLNSSGDEECLRCIFAYFRFFSFLYPWKRSWLLFHLIAHKFSLSEVALCPSLLEIPQMILEEKILNLLKVFSLFRYYLPLEMRVAIKYPLCYVWSVEFDSMAIEKKNVLIKFDVSSLFRYHVPFKKSVALISFKRTWIPFTQGCFEPSLVEIGPVVPEKKIF